MVHTAITNATKTATAVTDLTEPVSFDASLDGKEEPAKLFKKDYLNEFAYILI